MSKNISNLSGRVGLKENLFTAKINLSGIESEWTDGSQLKLPDGLETKLADIQTEQVQKKQALENAEAQLTTLQPQLEAAQKALNAANEAQKMQTSSEKQNFLREILHTILPQPARGTQDVKNLNILF